MGDTNTHSIANRPVTWALFLWILGGAASLLCTYILTHGMAVHKDAATIRELGDLRERIVRLEVLMTWPHDEPKRGPYDMSSPR